jgi:erythromycin esterase
MKIFLLGISLFLSFHINAQKDETIKWINENSIKIEDADPNTKLSIFNDNIPKKFENAKIFGFGEATHHGKEFFDVKAKFFKYLVETQNIKVFIIEDSYPSEAGINEWISGGKGNVETIANNFGIVPWYCKEIVNLLEWMRSYNLNKTKDEQIQFYGMDIQNVKGINQEIRDLVKNYNIPISEELLLVTDKCVDKKVEYNKSNDWANIQIPKLIEIENILVDFQKGAKYDTNTEFNSAIRALQYLKKYTYYIQNHYSQDRDLKMFENVKWITENKSKNGKAFIWAHNEHINNKGFANYSNRNINNLGWHLKEFYKDDYYSVGFDFGKGTLGGYVFNENERAKWNTYPLNKPFPDTYAATFIDVKDDIFFIDMIKALNNNPTDFFKSKNKQLILGASGYNPKQNNLFTKKISEMYDGLIFIKNITVPNYKLSEK